MKFLVTGGAGFIGSNIVERIVKEGERVKVVDNFSTGKRGNIQPFLDDIELIEGDLCDFEIAEKAVNGVDFVLHQAAIPSVSRSIENPLKTGNVNIIGTLNLLWAASKAGVKRFVYASSSSIYGDTLVLPKREDMVPNPLSPYAVSKLAGEHYCKIFYEIYGLQTVCLRYFNVFGARQDPNSQYAAAIPKFIKAMLIEEAPTIYGDGEQTRDFTYVGNVVEANLLAIKAEDAPGRTFNIACGKSISINELMENLNNILRKNIKPKYTSSRPGDVKHSLAGISQAKKVLNYNPQVDFEKGLIKTVEWLVSKR